MTVDTADVPGWVLEAFPAAHRFVEVEGHRVHLVDEGAGPVLLLVHGVPTWSYAWRHVVAGLRGEFRCVAVDLPGFGLSEAAPGFGYRPADHARVLAAVVRELALTDATLVVQDWGGPIGLRVAADDPTRFRALVVLNSWAWPLNGDLHFEWFSRLVGGPLGRLATLHLNALVRVLLPAATRRVGPDRSAMDAYRRVTRTRASRRAMAVLPREVLAARDWLAGLEADLARLAHLPALFVWGDADIAFRLRELERFQRLLPRSRARVLEGVGHLVQEEAPKELVAELRAWAPLQRG